jgi:GxxExxY protein
MGNPSEVQVKSDQLSNQIIAAALEVHRALGPGLLESAYESCLCHEFDLQKIPFEQQVPVPVEYKDLKLEYGYRLDMLVGGLVIVEIKAIDALQPIHSKQLLTYLRLKKLWLGILINFNVPLLKNGINRVVNGYG